MRDNIIDITVCIGRFEIENHGENLYDMIQNQNLKDVKIDFRNVNFATRSFMDEFYPSHKSISTLMNCRLTKSYFNCSHSEMQKT